MRPRGSSPSWQGTRFWGVAGARRADKGAQVTDSELALPGAPEVVSVWEGRGVRAACARASLRCRRLSRAAMPPRCQRFALIAL